MTSRTDTMAEVREREFTRSASRAAGGPRSAARYGSTVHNDAFAITFDEGSRSLVVTGDIDEPGAAALRDEIEARSSSYTGPVVVNLSDVRYLPSTAIGVLALAQKKAAEQGGSVELVAVSGSIAERVLKVCALPHRTA